MFGFLSKFAPYKHAIAAAWVGLYAAFEASPVMQTYVTTTAKAAYNSLPHWLAAFIAGVVIPLVTFYHNGIKSLVARAANNTGQAAAALFIAAAVLLGSTSALAQTATTPPATTTPVAANPNSLAPLSNFYGGGLSYINGGNPALSGTLIYAHPASTSTGTYLVTIVDVIPVATKPFTVNTNIGAGVAQRVATIASHDIYGITSLSLSEDSTNVGYSFTAGGGMPFKLKTSNWYAMPILRVYKSSITGSQGFMPQLGVVFAWGEPATPATP